MTFVRSLALFFASFLCAPLVQAGNEAVSRNLRDPSKLEAPTLEIAAESSYLWGSLANPNSYEVAAQFLTARLRWGTIQREGWFS